MAKKENKYKFLPYLGYAHIPGNEEKRSGSRLNKPEAQVIADWIQKNEERLTEASEKEIDATVAIITPFAAQKRVIIDSLKQLNSKYEKITVGTVHSLQGAERDVVIFSSVYSSEEGSYFFDKGVNMLNVAVSRAKHSFLVFGNMNVFKESGDAPSNLLARYLFENEENELTDIEPVKRLEFAKEIERIDTHERHDEVLSEALEEADEKVGIVSPFIRSAAKDAEILSSLRKAVERGIKVTVYADKRSNSLETHNFKEAIEALESTKVELIFLPNIHNKSLWKDDNFLVEGSFNWFSAVRKKDHAYHNYESSLVYRGREMADTIKKIETNFSSKKTGVKKE